MIRQIILKGEFIEEYSPFIGWSGFAFRGALGLALRSLICKNINLKCNECNFLEKCFYQYFFETKAFIKSKPLFVKNIFSEVIKPYVIDFFKINNKEVIFGLNLFGLKTLSNEPLIIASLNKMSSLGIGIDLVKKSRRIFNIKEIIVKNPFNENEEEVIFSKEKEYIAYDVNFRKQDITIKDVELKVEKIFNEKIKEITINFIYPTRIIYKRKGIIVPQFYHILKSLAKKYSGMCYYHDLGEPLEIEETKKIIEEAKRDIKLINHFEKIHYLKKISLKTNKEEELGTFITGAYSYNIPEQTSEKEEFKKILKLLIFGEFSHIGKWATAVCGKYKLYYDFR